MSLARFTLNIHVTHNMVPLRGSARNYFWAITILGILLFATSANAAVGVDAARELQARSWDWFRDKANKEDLEALVDQFKDLDTRFREFIESSQETQMETKENLEEVFIAISLLKENIEGLFTNQKKDKTEEDGLFSRVTFVSDLMDCLSRCTDWYECSKGCSIIISLQFARWVRDASYVLLQQWLRSPLAMRVLTFLFGVRSLFTGSIFAFGMKLLKGGFQTVKSLTAFALIMAWKLLMGSRHVQRIETKNERDDQQDNPQNDQGNGQQEDRQVIERKSPTDPSVIVPRVQNMGSRRYEEEIPQYAARVRVERVLDLNKAIEDISFLVADDCVRVHALMNKLDDTHSATARLKSFIRSECKRLTQSETLPRSSCLAAELGVNVADLWGHLIVLAKQFFINGCARDVISSIGVLESLRKETSESVHQFVSRYIAEFRMLDPIVPNRRALEILLRSLPQEFIRTLTDRNMDETSLDDIARLYRNFAEWTNCSVGGLHVAARGLRRPEPAREEPPTVLEGRRKGTQVGTGQTFAGKCFLCGRIGHKSFQCEKAGNRGRKAGNGRNAQPRVRQVEQNEAEEDSYSEASIVDDPTLPNREDFEEDPGAGGSGETPMNVSMVMPVLTSDQRAIRCAALPRHAVYGKIKIQHCGITSVLLDTGAGVSVLPIKTVREKGLEHSVDKSKRVKLRGFNNATETTEGVLLLGVRHGDRKCIVPFHVVQANTDPILGIQALKKMGLKWDLEKGSAEMGGIPVSLTTGN